MQFTDEGSCANRIAFRNVYADFNEILLRKRRQQKFRGTHARFFFPAGTFWRPRAMNESRRSASKSRYPDFVPLSMPSFTAACNSLRRATTHSRCSCVSAGKMGGTLVARFDFDLFDVIRALIAAINPSCSTLSTCRVADREGFEPSIPFQVYTLSRRAP